MRRDDVTETSTLRVSSMSQLTSRCLIGAIMAFGAIHGAAAQGERSKQATPDRTESAKPPATPATQASKSKPQQQDTATKIEVYGFAQADIGYDFEQNDPHLYDVNRPSKLPATHHQFGNDNRTFVSARQSLFGVKGWIPTNGPDIKTVFEWDLFGVGPDAGQFTIRPRHIYGQWG